MDRIQRPEVVRPELACSIEDLVIEAEELDPFDDAPNEAFGALAEPESQERPGELDSADLAGDELITGERIGERR